MRHFTQQEIEERLTLDVAIPAMRQAMITLSRQPFHQIPRAVVELSPGRLLGAMAGGSGKNQVFGSKIVSIFHDNHEQGRPSHQGVVILFDPDTGAPMCTADAYAITAIRTAAASAAASDVLARDDATRLAILGYGEQAMRHAEAMCKVRQISEIRVWGRSASRASRFADRLCKQLNIDAMAFAEVSETVGPSDIICTVTAAQDPILRKEDVSAGVHINAAGASLPKCAEIDSKLVAKSLFIPDCRENVVSSGGAFLRALKEGLVSEEHVLAEIGEVYSGRAAGRQSADDITIYKSLGHIIQDLAALAAILGQ